MGRRMGDVNLDGAVDATDFAIWQDHNFQVVTCTSWTSADFNGDRVVDVSDFNIWNDNKFQPVPAAAQADAVRVRQPRAALAAKAAAAIDEGFIHTVATALPWQDSFLLLRTGEPQTANVPNAPDSRRLSDWSGNTSLKQRDEMMNRRQRFSADNDRSQLVEKIEALFADLDEWL